LNATDQKAIDKFDTVIDGMEFNDRRKASEFILNKIPQWNGKVKIAKISANGHCGNINTRGGKVNIGEFALQSAENRPVQYHWKTLFHEYYHANMQGLDYSPAMFKGNWTKWEETATETSAFFMSDRAGINVATISPSYSDYLIETLPHLKQLDEFKDCVDMKDFGAKFMKYRFDPGSQTGDWTKLERQVATIPNKLTPKKMDKYFADNYLEHFKKNKERYTDMIMDSLQQTNKGPEIRRMISSGIDRGINSGTVTREIRMAMPIAYNDIGVVKP
jgi:hypothetical protein